jgi:acyl-CoA synthetase (AMP-forming)/AMP-acid ligase II
MNLGTYLDTAVERYTDLPYLQFYDQTVTYGEFGRQVNILANALKRQGFQKGDFIHVLVQNSPQTLMAYFAIQKIGAVAGPVNGWWKAPEVQYLLNDSKGRGLIVEDQYLPILDEIKADCPHLEKIIEVSNNPRSEHIDFAGLLAEGDDTPVSVTATLRIRHTFSIPPAPPETQKACCCPTRMSWPTWTGSPGRSTWKRT